MKKEDLTTAAEMLRKGGTLLAEACEVCKGVQIKFKDSIICMQCGNRVILSKGKEESLEDVRVTILKKLNELAQLLSKENDIKNQLELIKVIERYVELLEKIKNI